jgi:hypothetical protein
MIDAARTAPPSGAPNGADACPDTQRHQDPAIRVGQAESPRQHRREAGRDLSGRAFTAARTARTDGQRAGNHLHQYDPGADLSRIGVHRLDCTVRAMAGGFGGKPSHNQRRHQRSCRRHQRDRPSPEVVGRPGTATLGQGGGDVVAGQIAQQKFAGVPQRQVKDDRAQAGDNTDHDAQDEPLAQIPRIPDECAQPAAAVRVTVVHLASPSLTRQPGSGISRLGGPGKRCGPCRGWPCSQASFR